MSTPESTGEPSRPASGAPVPDFVLYGGNGNAVKLWAILYVLADADGWVRRSVLQLAADSGMSPGTVTRAVQDLRQLDALEIDYSKPRGYRAHAGAVLA